MPHHYQVKYHSEDRSRNLVVELRSRHPEPLFKVVGASVDGCQVPVLTLDDILQKAVKNSAGNLSELSMADVAKCLDFDPDNAAAISTTPLLPTPPEGMSGKPSSPSTVTTLGSPDSSPVSDLHPQRAVDRLRTLLFSLPALDLIAPVAEDSSQPLLISIEGNVGAGKSTLLQTLKKLHPEWVFIEEPVEFWSSLRNSKGQSLFELYYEDQSRWAYTFQNCAVLSRYQSTEQTITEHINRRATTTTGRLVFITERCLSSDHGVFAKMLHQGTPQRIDTLEMTLYEKWLRHLQRSSTPLSAVIHVDTPAEICHARVKGRHREGEEGVALEYLREVGQYQKAWVEAVQRGQASSPGEGEKGIPVHTTGPLPTDEDAVKAVEAFVQRLAGAQSGDDPSSLLCKL